MMDKDRVEDCTHWMCVDFYVSNRLLLYIKISLSYDLFDERRNCVPAIIVVSNQIDFSIYDLVETLVISLTFMLIRFQDTDLYI